MKRSVLLLVYAVVAHLFIIDAVFFAIPEIPLIEPYLILAYNGIWLLMAFSIWNHKYDASRG